MERRKNPLEAWKGTWMDRYFDLPLWSRAAFIGLVAALLMFTMDGLAHALGYPWFVERLYEDVLEGLVVGFLAYWLSRLREKRLERRLREIGFLNHHIRNAMQTIELVATQIPDTEQRETLVLSVRRVIETLSSITRESDARQYKTSIPAAHFQNNRVPQRLRTAASHRCRGKRQTLTLESGLHYA